jgi:hypothetical protein
MSDANAIALVYTIICLTMAVMSASIIIFWTILKLKKSAETGMAIMVNAEPKHDHSYRQLTECDVPTPRDTEIGEYYFRKIVPVTINGRQYWRDA